MEIMITNKHTEMNQGMEIIESLYSVLLCYFIFCLKINVIIKLDMEVTTPTHHQGATPIPPILTPVPGLPICVS